MKTLLISLGIAIICQSLSAQRIVEESIPVNKNQEVKLEFDFADQITVKSWDKNEVAVKATVNINNNENNDRFKFKTRKGSNYISIQSEIENLKDLHCQTIIIEDGDTTIINGIGTQMNIDFDVLVPSNAELDLETINGDIELHNLKGKLDINTINGEIDMFVTNDLKADLSLKTINGTMFTDLDMEFSQTRDNLCKVGGNVDTKLNGGGQKINLETINGTIYLRKKK
jgi:DUF4097 and DUF4098 domain-containing protein YvlB